MRAEPELSLSSGESRPTFTALKQLSVNEWVKIEVISVSKRPEKLIDTPSTIQAVTNEEIQRLGATNISEALIACRY